MNKISKIVGVAFAGATMGLVLFGTGNKSPVVGYASDALTNYALHQGAWVETTSAVSDSISYDANGIHLENWGTVTDDTAGVFLKDKVSQGMIVTSKVKLAKASGGQRQDFKIQLHFANNIERSSLQSYKNEVNQEGYAISITFQSDNWDNVTISNFNQYYTYEAADIAQGNTGKNGTLSGAYNPFDGKEHVFEVIKVDTESGIKLSVSVDGVYYLDSYEIKNPITFKVSGVDGSVVEPSAFKGDYFYAIGVRAGGATLEGDKIDIGSVTVAKNEGNKNYAVDSTKLAQNTTIVDGSVVTSENGTTISNYADEGGKTAGVFVTDKFDNGEEVQITVNSANSAGNRLYVMIGLLDKVPLQSFLTYKNSVGTGYPTGRIINIDFRSNWVQCDVRTNSLYYTYDHFVLADGNTNNGVGGTVQNGGFNIFDGADHIIKIKKTNTTYGISLDLTVDSTSIYSGLATNELTLTGGNTVVVGGSEFKGNYYLGVGMVGDNATTTSDVTTVKSIVGSNHGIHVDYKAIKVNEAREAISSWVNTHKAEYKEEQQTAIETAAATANTALDTAVVVGDIVKTFYDTVSALKTAAVIDTETDAARVDELILSIGTVTLESKTAIQAARAAYNELSDDAKALVTELSTLEAAETTLARLEQEAAAAAELAKAKTDAKAELDEAYGALDLTKYSEENKTALTNALATGKAAIDAATDKAGVASALSDAKAALNAVPQVEPEPTPEPTPEEAPKKGCGGSIVASSLIVSTLAMVGVGLISKKRKEND